MLWDLHPWKYLIFAWKKALSSLVWLQNQSCFHLVVRLIYFKMSFPTYLIPWVCKNDNELKADIYRIDRVLISRCWWNRGNKHSQKKNPHTKNLFLNYFCRKRIQFCSVWREIISPRISSDVNSQSCLETYSCSSPFIAQTHCQPKLLCISQKWNRLKRPVKVT